MIITKNIYKFTTEFSQDKKNKLVTKYNQNLNLGQWKVSVVVCNIKKTTKDQ